MIFFSKKPSHSKTARTHIQRRVAGILFLLIFSISVVGGVIAKPKPAQALFGVGDVSITAGDIPRTIYTIIAKMQGLVKAGLVKMGQIALINAIDYYVQNLAYETATRIATGAPGQDSLVYGKPVLEGLLSAGDAAIGDYLESLSKDVFGKSLCEPLNPQFKLQLGIEIESINKPPKPKCTLSRMQQTGIFSQASLSNINSQLNNLTLEETMDFSHYFDPRENQLGLIQYTKQTAAEKKAAKERAAEIERLANGTFKNLTNTAGTEIKTGAAIIEGSLRSAQEKATDESTPTKPAGDQLLTILSRGLSTFSRTFLGKWTQQLFEKGFVPPNVGPSDSRLLSGVTGISAAREYYAVLKEQNFATQRDVEISAQLANCPANTEARQWNNCRISEGMKQAIDRQLTVSEAIDQKLIRPGEIFGYNAKSGSYPRYSEGLPYPSLAVMRKYRIVPVGWELAALYIKDVMQAGDHNGKNVWTIQDVMNCYEDPASPNDNTLPIECRANGVNPFYHLVNPNWVLKAPETVCYKEGPGPEISFEQVIEVPVESTSLVSANQTVEFEQQRVVSRIDWCADERGCIQEDKDGNCLWNGYCVLEKPVWRFEAESCPAEYNTCQTLAMVEGSYGRVDIGDNTDVGYITKTLQPCSIGDVGCGWYSTAYDYTTRTWEGNTDINGNGVPDRLYANNNASDCDAADEGCTKFFIAADDSDPLAGPTILGNALSQARGGASYESTGLVRAVFMKKAPEERGCGYGGTGTGCTNYAVECSANELGCMYYTPLDGGQPVPAKITPADLCDESCIGVGTFTYVGSLFEDMEDDGSVNGSPSVPVTMIPTTGQACSEPGCDAFTNLAIEAQGGNATQYYTSLTQCVPPDAAGNKTYFTWEGSDTSGYQLKRWVMLSGGSGAPCTSVTPGSSTCSTTTSCTDTTNPACRNFFDESGNTYWANINQLIYASEDCQALRRDESGATYYAIPSRSQSCSSNNNLCRSYNGAGTNNVRIIFSSDFESSSDPLSGWQGGTLSNESMTLGGHSMAIGSATRNISSQIQTGRFYSVSFFAKGSSVQFQIINGVDSPQSIGSTSLGSEWQQYTLGPIQLAQAVNANSILRVAGNGFVDGITFEEAQGGLALIKDSWDQNLANQCVSNGDLSCRLYRPDRGPTVALKSFSQLCQDKYIGCVAMIDTYNSNIGDDHAQPGVWNTENNSSGLPADLLDDIRVEGDNIKYIVNDRNKHCSPSAKGCEMVGQPIFNNQVETTGGFGGYEVIDFIERGIINDPDLYDLILCSGSSLFCSLYTDNNGRQVAYVDPGNRVCEYVNRTIEARAPGWYQAGTGIPCNPLTGGTEYDPLQPVPFADPLDPTLPNLAYQGWVGVCPIQYNSCSQLIDPEPQSGTGVYYILHDQLESAISECSEDGVVDREAGCRLFADTENYSTSRVLGTIDAYDTAQSLDGQAPVSSGVPAENNANLLLKVKPDRVCQEFLYCTSELSFDNTTLQENLSSSVQKGQQSICLGVGLCKQLDDTGRCIDSTADVYQSGQAVYQQGMTNTSGSANLAGINQARWATGLTKFGGAWPQGEVGGLYPYHHMFEVGSPMTIPNSNFESKNNFGKLGTTWPNITAGGTLLQQNARIVGKTAGIYPYEGNSMLELNLDTDDPNVAPRAFITSAELPASPNLEMVVSMYVNFNTLKQPIENRCVTGRIGDTCTSNAQCSLSGTCSTISTTGGYCVKSVAGSYNECTNQSQCGGVPCSVFRCESGPNAGDLCDPNNGVGLGNPTCNSGGVNYACSQGGNPGPQQICTSGDPAKIGSACSSSSDCSTSNPLCEPVGSALTLSITNGTATTNITSQEVANIGRNGWKQVTIPFQVSGSTFRIRLNAQGDPGLVSGSVMIDNLEIRSGLKISSSEIVAPSCRLYPRVDGLETDALACEYVDRGNISGQELTTYKGWRGYCVEEVPDMPGICMNWWPVDVVQGDVNFFGDGGLDDITINGSTPVSDMYYCLQSTGSLSNATVVNYGQCAGTFNRTAPGCSTQVTVDACNTVEGCFWADPNLVGGQCFGDSCSDFGDMNSCQTASGCSWDAALGACSNGASCSGFTTETNCTGFAGCTWNVSTSGTGLTPDPYVQLAQYNIFNCNADDSCNSPRYYDPPHNCNSDDAIWHPFMVTAGTIGACARYCDANTMTDCSKRYDILPSDAESGTYKDQIQTVRFNKVSARREFPSWIMLDRLTEITEPRQVDRDQAVHSSFVIPPGGTAWYVDCNGQNPPQGPNGQYCAGSDDVFEVAVIFDATGRLVSYWWTADDETGEQAEPVAYRAEFFTRDICLTIAQVNTEYGSRVPWVSRFNDGSSALPMEKNDDAFPYGAVAAPSLEFSPADDSPENPWLDEPIFAMSSSESLYCGDGLLPQQCARAGTPYSCIGDCGDTMTQNNTVVSGPGKVCIGGSADKLGKYCRTNNDCINADLPTGQGVCGGVTGDMSFDTGGTDVAIDGVLGLRQLFAKSQAIYGWDFVKNKYVLCDTNAVFADLPPSCFVPTSLTGGPIGATGPVLWPFTGANAQGTALSLYDITGCGDGSFRYTGTSICQGIDSTGKSPVVQDMLVNGQTGNVVIYAGDYVTFEFFPGVNKDRTPLKALRVDWGDGTPLSPNQDFSNLAGQGLPINTYFFVHHYTKTGTYKPKVQLKDNWGWCSGDIYNCSGSGGFIEFTGTIEVRSNSVRGSEQQPIFVD